MDINSENGCFDSDFSAKVQESYNLLQTTTSPFIGKPCVVKQDLIKELINIAEENFSGQGSKFLSEVISAGNLTSVIDPVYNHLDKMCNYLIIEMYEKEYNILIKCDEIILVDSFGYEANAEFLKYVLGKKFPIDEFQKPRNNLHEKNEREDSPDFPCQDVKPTRLPARKHCVLKSYKKRPAECPVPLRQFLPLISKSLIYGDYIIAKILDCRNDACETLKLQDKMKFILLSTHSYVQGRKSTFDKKLFPCYHQCQDPPRDVAIIKHVGYYEDEMDIKRKAMIDLINKNESGDFYEDILVQNKEDRPYHLLLSYYTEFLKNSHDHLCKMQFYLSKRNSESGFPKQKQYFSVLEGNLITHRFYEQADKSVVMHAFHYLLPEAKEDPLLNVRKEKLFISVPRRTSVLNQDYTNLPWIDSTVEILSKLQHGNLKRKIDDKKSPAESVYTYLPWIDSSVEFSSIQHYRSLREKLNSRNLLPEPDYTDLPWIDSAVEFLSKRHQGSLKRKIKYKKSPEESCDRSSKRKSHKKVLSNVYYQHGSLKRKFKDRKSPDQSQHGSLKRKFKDRKSPDQSQHGSLKRKFKDRKSPDQSRHGSLKRKITDKKFLSESYDGASKRKARKKVLSNVYHQFGGRKRKVNEDSSPETCDRESKRKADEQVLSKLHDQYDSMKRKFYEESSSDSCDRELKRKTLEQVLPNVNYVERDERALEGISGPANLVGLPYRRGDIVSTGPKDLRGDTGLMGLADSQEKQTKPGTIGFAALRGLPEEPGKKDAIKQIEPQGILCAQGIQSSKGVQDIQLQQGFPSPAYLQGQKGLKGKEEKKESRELLGSTLEKESSCQYGESRELLGSTLEKESSCQDGVSSDEKKESIISIMAKEARRILRMELEKVLAYKRERPPFTSTSENYYMLDYESRKLIGSPLMNESSCQYGVRFYPKYGYLATTGDTERISAMELAKVTDNSEPGEIPQELRELLGIALEDESSCQYGESRELLGSTLENESSCEYVVVPYDKHGFSSSSEESSEVPGSALENKSSFQYNIADNEPEDRVSSISQESRELLGSTLENESSCQYGESRDLLGRALENKSSCQYDKIDDNEPENRFSSISQESKKLLGSALENESLYQHGKIADNEPENRFSSISQESKKLLGSALENESLYQHGVSYDKEEEDIFSCMAEESRKLLGSALENESSYQYGKIADNEPENRFSSISQESKKLLGSALENESLYQHGKIADNEPENRFSSISQESKKLLGSALENESLYQHGKIADNEPENRFSSISQESKKLLGSALENESLYQHGVSYDKEEEDIFSCMAEESRKLLGSALENESSYQYGKIADNEPENRFSSISQESKKLLGSALENESLYQHGVVSNNVHENRFSSISEESRELMGSTLENESSCQYVKIADNEPENRFSSISQESRNLLRSALESESSCYPGIVAYNEPDDRIPYISEVMKLVEECKPGKEFSILPDALKTLLKETCDFDNECPCLPSEYKTLLGETSEFRNECSYLPSEEIYIFEYSNLLENVLDSEIIYVSKTIGEQFAFASSKAWKPWIARTYTPVGDRQQLNILIHSIYHEILNKCLGTLKACCLLNGSCCWKIHINSDKTRSMEALEPLYQVTDHPPLLTLNLIDMKTRKENQQGELKALLNEYLASAEKMIDEPFTYVAVYKKYFEMVKGLKDYTPPLTIYVILKELDDSIIASHGVDYFQPGHRSTSLLEPFDPAKPNAAVFEHSKRRLFSGWINRPEVSEHTSNIPTSVNCLNPEQLGQFNELKKQGMEFSYEGKFEQSLKVFQEALNICECPVVIEYFGDTKKKLFHQVEDEEHKRYVMKLILEKDKDQTKLRAKRRKRYEKYLFSLTEDIKYLNTKENCNHFGGTMETHEWHENRSSLFPTFLDIMKSLEDGQNCLAEDIPFHGKKNADTVQIDFGKFFPDFSKYNSGKVTKDKTNDAQLEEMLTFLENYDVDGQSEQEENWQEKLEYINTYDIDDHSEQEEEDWQEKYHATINDWDIDDMSEQDSTEMTEEYVNSLYEMVYDFRNKLLE